MKARLLLADGDAKKACALLEPALDPRTPDAVVARLLGKLYYDEGAFDRTAEVYELARKTEPYEDRSLRDLVRVYEKTRDTHKLIELLQHLVMTDADDLASRKRLTRRLPDAGRSAEAARYGRSALEIDALDDESRQMVLTALQEQKEPEEAERLRKRWRNEREGLGLDPTGRPRIARQRFRGPGRRRAKMAGPGKGRDGKDAPRPAGMQPAPELPRRGHLAYTSSEAAEAQWSPWCPWRNAPLPRSWNTSSTALSAFAGCA